MNGWILGYVIPTAVIVAGLCAKLSWELLTEALTSARQRFSRRS